MREHCRTTFRECLFILFGFMATNFIIRIEALGTNDYNGTMEVNNEFIAISKNVLVKCATGYYR